MRDWRNQDAALDAAYEEMQSQPFEPTAGESVASVFGGLAYMGFNVAWLVLVAVVLYLIGKAVVG